MSAVEQSIRQFVQCFGTGPEQTAYAPGRVTVIGGHADYNGGLVISTALPLGTAVSIGRCDGPRLGIVSNRQTDAVELPVGADPKDTPESWTRYITGVLAEMGHNHCGLHISIWSDVPMQRGLASSAALTVSMALAIAQLFGVTYSPGDLAVLCQRVEQKHVGVRCGILDPYMALHARERQLLLIDCASVAHTETTLPSDLSIVVSDSGVDRSLAKSQYNLRRAECEQVAQAVGRAKLRDVTLDDLESVRPRLPVAARRAEHVITEIERVKAFWQALRIRDDAAVKATMSAAHQSCRDGFECSHPALDTLVAQADRHPACIGARLTGGGWGGATVNLVYREGLDRFCKEIASGRLCIV